MILNICELHTCRFQENKAADHSEQYRLQFALSLSQGAGSSSFLKLLPQTQLIPMSFLLTFVLCVLTLFIQWTLKGEGQKQKTNPTLETNRKHLIPIYSMTISLSESRYDFHFSSGISLSRICPIGKFFHSVK